MKPATLATAAPMGCMFSALPAVSPAADRTPSSPATRAAWSKDDTHRFQRLAEGNLAEVEAGRLAQSKAVSEAVRKFAARMVEDHTKMADDQRALAASRGLAMPTTPDKDHTAFMKRLQSQSGATFDRSYMTQMVKDHERTLKLVKEIAEKAKDADFKAAGEKAMPRIQEHLDMAKRIAADTELPDKVERNAPRK